MMDSDCETMKDQIADFVTGILSEDQEKKLRKHLAQCAACRDYARALQNEDTLLTEFVETMDADMTRRQERLLQIIHRSCQSKQIETPSIRSMIMKSPITKYAAAAMIILTVIVGLRYFQSGPAYGITDLPGLLGKAKTVHATIKRFSNDEELHSEFWYDLENGRMYRYFEGRTSWRAGKYVTETIWDNEYITRINHKSKTVTFEKLLASQHALNVQVISDMALKMALQGIQYLDQYTKVGRGQIEGQSYDIWQREFQSVDSGLGFRYEIWVSPTRGDIGRTRRWGKYGRSGREWILESEIEKVETNVFPPENLFTMEAPEGYALENSRASAEITSIGFDTFRYQGGYELRIPVSLILQDGSVLVCWNENHPTTQEATTNPFAEPTLGAALPRTAISLYGLMSPPDRNHRQPTTYYVGRHLFHTQKAGQVYEWALYIPQREVVSVETTRMTIAVMKLNVQDPNLSKVMPTWGLTSPVVTPDVFDRHLHDAIMELSNENAVAESLTYDALLALARKVRIQSGLYVTAQTEMREARDHILQLEPVKIVTPEQIEEQTEQAVQEIRRVVESFYAAIIDGRDTEARQLLRYQEPRASRTVDGMKQLPGLSNMRIEDIYATDTSGLAITNEFAVFEGKGGAGWAISVLKEKGLWLIKDFDATTTAGKQKEIEKYLKVFPNARHVNEK